MKEGQELKEFKNQIPTEEWTKLHNETCFHLYISSSNVKNNKR
jgi:hypothetical protein